MKSLRGLVFLAIAICALPLSAYAHDPGLSSANIEIAPDEIRVALTFNARDLSAIANGGTRDALAARASEVWFNGGPITASRITTREDASLNIEFDLSYPRPAGATQLQFRSRLISELPFGHREAVAVRDGSGREYARALLSASAPSLSVTLEVPSSAPTRLEFVDFLLLGVRHILTGYDHLLFLFGLLIMCRTARNAALLITCFTAAHSLTLGLATFGLVELQSRIVESTIAASILYVGVENLLRAGSAIRGRWVLTFAFGLIHGLGFATVLREMGIGQNGAAAVVPLVGFNLGVELGQLSVATIALPIMILLRRRPVFVKIGVPACSAAVAAAGAYWFVQRAFVG